ncbi:receptor-like protein 15 isoform X2 [Quercus robur]|uniref:receptor-like protein 15 isoform X2 n=1 Tax=Quercus robur TaxID=38942 RepID=UPI0021635C12|nr:receptor-like protein 15 isoform X2 [Quercus robur]
MEFGHYWWWPVVLVLVHFNMNGCFGCWEQERISLLELKASIVNYTDKYYFPHWDSADKENDCCEWEKVKCDITTGRVIKLALNNTIYWGGESGGGWHFNASLFLPFEELQYLDLSFNSISRWIPSEGFERFSTLGKLEVLHLGDNSFNNSILQSFSGTIASLKELHLDYNSLNGSIDIQDFKAFNNLEELYLGGNHYINDFVTTEELGALNNLEQLYLDDSSIDNCFLHKVGVMNSLEVLSVQFCRLNGSLPAQGWCELRKLQEIDLSYNNFEGILPSCMANLTSLQELDLSNNHFTGNIAHSPLPSLTSLEHLSLSNNDFLIPATMSTFSNLSNLKDLLGDNNKIAFEPDSHTWIPTFQLQFLSLSNGLNVNGTTPRFLHYQYELVVIDLSHNNLFGKFPTWLLEISTKLESLFLNNNSFTGPFMLPYDICHNIRNLDISDNHLQGPIPINFGLILPSLEYLNMSKNAFQGSIPSFGKLVFLQFLGLSENHLSGTIPMHFGMGCHNVHFLKLSYNNFSGQIFPTHFNLTNLESLLLDNNHFSGMIPNSISISNYLYTIDFSNNHFSGMLPTGLGNMSLWELVMAKNQLEGTIPIELCKLVRLQFLDLSENNLSGSIPSCFNSSYLTSVYLNKNLLSGPIPCAFKNNSNLVTLNLRDNLLIGNISDWIGNLSSLSILLLRENHLEGRIPSQLCLLQNLHLLDLSYNKFSGTIPHCLSNITFVASTQELNSRGFSDEILKYQIRMPYLKTKSTNMKDWNYMGYFETDVKETDEAEFTTKNRIDSYHGDVLNYMFGIDLSCNKLVGEIPPQLGMMSTIRAMNLSHNKLTGPIPTTFSNLKQMESLDLSYNNLSGKIPSELTEITFLEVFSVAHNNLSGTTPERKYQFGTFDESCYEGNPLLCGPPLHDCAKIGPPSTMLVDHDGEDGGSFIDMAVFYISFVVVYITVLLGLVAVLYINPYWRRAWFNFIEVCVDNCYCFVVVHYRKLFNFMLA